MQLINGLKNMVKLQGKGIIYQDYIDIYINNCSYYLGAFPRLIVADLDIVKEIMVKQFDKFTDRSVHKFLTYNNNLLIVYSLLQSLLVT